MPASTSAEVERELEELAEQHLARLQAGELPDRSDTVRAYPHLGERLERRLILVELLYRMSRTQDVSPPPPADPTVRAVHPVVPEPSPSSLTVPTATVLPLEAAPPRFRDFEVLGELGRGGMGVVFKARQKGLNRLVALKVILAGTSARLEDRIRFKLEGEALASLQHPNVVQVYEVGEQEGVPFLALEFVDGITLEQALAGESQPPRETAQLIEKVARAMHAAHQHGIIHRDLKPANVLLASGGCQEPVARAPGLYDAPRSPALTANARLSLASCTPKVADFGLAKRWQEPTGPTRTEIAVGTPCYMAPEQAQAGAGRVGPATDVWALGAILYECLTGQPPFLAETSLDTLRQVIGEEPMPPSQRRAGVPRDLEVVCLKCLEKQPQQRYASAEALADDLRRFLDDEPIHARPVGRLERLVKWVRRRPALAALALVSVLALAGVVGLELRHSARVRVERDRAEQSLALSLEAVNKLMTEVSEEHLADEPHLEEYRRVMLTRALAYYQRLLDVHGDDPRLREETAEAARRKGDALRLLAQYTEAEEAYREAIDRFDQLARQGEGRSYRLTLAGCYTDLGEVLSLTDRTAASRREYDHALEVEERLLEQDRQDPACLQERARTLYNLGILLRKSGQLQEAKQSLGQAVVVLKGLTGRFEDRPRYWQHLARSHLNLGTALRDAKEHLKARASCGEAITILEKMTRRWPRVPDYKHELAVTRNNLGNLLGDRKLYKEALAEHDEARALFAKLAEDFPRVPKYRLELANTYNSRGRVLSQQGDLAGARQAREQARERLEKLVREPDAPPSYHADLGRTYGNLGVVFYKQAEQEKARGHTDRERHHRQDARDHFRKAIRHLEEARGSNRDNPDYLLALRENYRSLAETVLQLHEDREAAEAARSLAAVAAGLPRETYFAACFMARCAAASGGEERQQRIALALQYLQQAVDAGFNDLPLFEKDCKDKFAILEKEKAFLTISQKLRVRAEQKRLPDSPKR